MELRQRAGAGAFFVGVYTGVSLPVLGIGVAVIAGIAGAAPVLVSEESAA